MKYSYGDKVKILIGFYKGRTGKIIDVKETTIKDKTSLLITATNISYQLEFTIEKGEKPIKQWFEEFQLKKESFLEKEWF